MKICYKSFDGKEFNTEEECRRYEENIKIKMYSFDGLTNNPKLAFAVKINGIEAAKKFIKMCNEWDVSHTGVNYDLNGIYVWSSYCNQYFLLEPLTCKALKECFEDTEMQE